MKLLGRFVAMTLVGIAATTASVLPARAAAPILVKSCTILKPKPLSQKASGTAITYVNLAKKTVSSVTFAVGYRNSSEHFVRRVQDVGSFAPGVTIDHTFSLFNDVTYGGAHTTLCVPTQVKYAGGTIWVAPTKP
jgi:hypothetical protein